MNILGFNIERSKKKNYMEQYAGLHDLRSGNPYGGVMQLGDWQSDLSKTVRSNYANAFAPISAIVDEVVKRNLRLVMPNDYSIDVSKREPLWYAMNRPNSDMDLMSLLGIMISGFTSLNELSLLLWHHNGERTIPGRPDGGFDLKNIAGFTVLPKCAKTQNAAGETVWRVMHRKHGMLEFCNKSVITLKYGVLPDDGVTGISPGSSSEQESSIRDSLNIYERGFFANGAKPSLIVTIHCRSKDEFNLIRNEYEMANRGAGKQGGVVYQAMYDAMPEGFGAAAPSIEVTPIGSVNDTLAINDIVSYTERTINGNYGISPIIWGDASTTTYQNQQLVDKKFMARVQSILVRLFSNFERELCRICKLEELPFKFCWDSTDFELTEEVQLKTKINSDNIANLKELISLGATVEQAVEVLCLPEEWAQIEFKPNASLLHSSTGNANAMAIRSLIELGADPDKAAIALGLPDTWQGLGLSAPTLAEQAELRMQTGLLSSTNELTKASESKPDESVSNENIPEHFEVKIDEPEKLKTIRELLQKIAQDRADAALGVISNSPQTDGEYIQEMLAILTTLANDGGARTIAELQSMADALELDISLVEYSMSSENLQAIQDRAEQVLANYSEFLDEQISKYQSTDPDNLDTVLAAALAIGIISVRADMIAIGESKNAYQSGQYDAAKNTDGLLQASNCYIVKTWNASGLNPCEFCLSINGTQAGISDSFVPEGMIHADDHTLVLDENYTDGTLPDAHAHCVCTWTFRIVRK
jgi:hypothetical protein